MISLITSMAIKYPDSSAGTSRSDRRKPMDTPEVINSVLVGPGTANIARMLRANASWPIIAPQQNGSCATTRSISSSVRLPANGKTNATVRTLRRLPDHIHFQPRPTESTREQLLLQTSVEMVNRIAAVVRVWRFRRRSRRNPGPRRTFAARGCERVREAAGSERKAFGLAVTKKTCKRSTERVCA